MSRIIAIWIALAALTLGGCAAQLKNAETAWSVLTQASVSPTAIIVAGNAFDAAEASATQYLLACKASALPPSACTLSTRKSVVSAVRAGRAARTGLEPYVVSGEAGPAALYNSMIGAINTLQGALPAAQPAGAHP